MRLNPNLPPPTGEGHGDSDGSRGADGFLVAPAVFSEADGDAPNLWAGFVDAAVSLPCFWSYAEIAERHREALQRNPVSVYRRWPSVYLSDDYLGLVRRLREVLDSSGLSAEALWPYFRQASVYK